MKKLLILNGLILSGLAISAQNTANNEDNVYASNVQVNYTTNITTFSPQTNVSSSNVQMTTSNIQMSTVQINGNRGGSATNKLKSTNNNQVQVQTQVQVSNKPKQQKSVEVNTNPVVNDNNGNLYDNNVGNMSNPNVNRGNEGTVNNDVNFNSNPQVNNKTTTTKTVVVMEEFKGTDFKPIGLSGRDYSNGGKMKKGVKNFPKADHKKVKHKKKPGYKKVKYRTSNCAKW